MRRVSWKAWFRFAALLGCFHIVGVQARAQTADAPEPGATPPQPADAAGETDPLAGLEPLGEPRGGPTVTLAEAFDLARARHPSLRGIRSEIDRADGLLHQAWGTLLPRLSAQLTYMLNDQDTTVDIGAMMPAIPGLETPDPIVVRRQNVAQSQVSVQVPLLNMPVYSVIESASIGRSIAGLSEEEAERQLLLGVAVAYHGALAAGELVTLQQDAWKAATERLRAARIRRGLEANRPIDVARAELEVETARLGHQAAILAYERARQALAGLIVSDDLPVPADPGGTEAAPGSADDLVRQAMSDRPDLDIRRTAVDLAEQNLWTAWTAFFPTLSAGWQITTELTDPAGFGGRRNQWTLALVFGIPLYDESRYGLLDQRRADVEAAEAAVETAELSVSTEIRSAWLEYESSLATIETASRQSEVAREALRLAEAGFEQGAGTSLDVEDAQQRLNAALAAVAIQRWQSRMVFVRLLFLAGRIPE